jgi:multidrug efflux pump subunit AcrA (membrane-fusion protein)
MDRSLNLQELARERSSSVERGNVAATMHRPRSWLTRYGLPLAILVSFVSMIVWATREAWLPAQDVAVVPVIVARAQVHQPRTPLFQAAGWVEPRPTPVYVSALAEGVLDKLLVVEGDDVEAGQVIARLIDTDAQIARDAAQADLELRQAERASAYADLNAAEQRMAHPLHLDAPLAEARSQLAATETELAQLPARIRAARARSLYARQNLEGKRGAGEAVSARLIQQAESELEAAEAVAEELIARQNRLGAEIAAWTAKVEAMTQQRDLLIEERRALAEAKAQLDATAARVKQAQVAVRNADLQWTRMTVRAPVSGRILKLLSAPGSRLMGLSQASQQDASMLVSLYDPGRLQVRADVRLEDVPLVTSGQPVRIESAAISTSVQGVVLLATSEANLQKNTLEVKVAVIDPPPSLRPEMLVQATFLAPERATSQDDASEQPERLLIPPELVQGEGDAAYVWIAAADNTARRRPVSLGSATGDGLVEILQGLHPTDKVISTGRDSLTEAKRIRIVTNGGSSHGAG